jgi:hypothetical protein
VRVEVDPFIPLDEARAALAATGAIAQKQCPFWVKSGYRVAFASCPFFPSKQTFVSASGTSAMCQKRKWPFHATLELG